MIIHLKDESFMKYYVLQNGVLIAKVENRVYMTVQNHKKHWGLGEEQPVRTKQS